MGRSHFETLRVLVVEGQADSGLADSRAALATFECALQQRERAPAAEQPEAAPPVARGLVAEAEGGDDRRATRV